MEMKRERERNNIIERIAMEKGTGRKKKFEEKYQMNDGWVKSVDEERDLRVVISKDLKIC